MGKGLSCLVCSPQTSRLKVETSLKVRISFHVCEMAQIVRIEKLYVVKRSNQGGKIRTAFIRQECLDAILVA